MSDKLSPKPSGNREPEWGWDMLNNFLQDTFKRPAGEQNWSRIDTMHYKMSKEEIIAELKQQGYNVREESETSLFLT